MNIDYANTQKLGLIDFLMDFGFVGGHREMVEGVVISQPEVYLEMAMGFRTRIQRDNSLSEEYRHRLDNYIF